MRMVFPSTPHRADLFNKRMFIILSDLLFDGARLPPPTPSLQRINPFEATAVGIYPENRATAARDWVLNTFSTATSYSLIFRTFRTMRCTAMGSAKAHLA